MPKKITLEDIDRRLTALEKAVASLTVEKGSGAQREVPSGKFAHLGGIERRPATFEGTASLDLSEAHGKTGRRIR